ncbi:VCBS repeat-containing protein [Paraflavitalea speifideaquila]|uniref:FG-GAP repeat domain-containing protein n=1 Tax=Paraflavitalea speifideaquila TaxID=3076558 RepID=UPI0028E20470|nr:VCBS repeat-containing protein [Paraflavitalea speifideiaquila]
MISSYWENGIRIYYGNKAGEFINSTYLFTGVHGREVRCVDINNDGHIDIVTTTSGSGHTISLHVFINKGDGTFLPQQIYPSLLDTCKEIFITDKNNDGLPDVVVSSSFSWLLFYYQQPDGSFKAQYRPTNTTARVNFCDVNQDNREDLLLLYASFDNMPGTDSMLILLNTGDTSFSEPYKVPQFNSHKIRPTQVRMADFNRDGYQDMLVNQVDWLGDYDDTLFYMMGRANAGFYDPVAISMPANVLYCQLADLNKDGFPDLIVSCDNNTLYTFFNSNGKALETTTELLVYPNPASSRLFLKGLPEGGIPLPCTMPMALYYKPSSLPPGGGVAPYTLYPLAFITSAYPDPVKRQPGHSGNFEAGAQ